VDPESVRGASRVPHGGSNDPDVLDFSANVNPETPDGVAAAYREALAAARRYPDDDYPEFRDAAAGYVDCAAGDVVPTPGGLAAIRLAMEITLEPGDSVAVPYPSFGEYAREVRLQGADPVFVPAADVTGVDPADHALVVACNPNNPTGRAYDHGALLALLDRCRDAGTPLLVDEAFLGFTDRPSLASREGAAVARSLTKLFGLPGLRAGFAVATGDVGDALATARRTWNLGTPAAAVGAHCMRRDEFVARTRNRVRTERARMRDALADRFEVSPSSAPFLLLDVGDRSVEVVVAAARERGVAVRDATTFRGLDSHVRVAVRTPEDNDRLLAVLADV
jgi:histidinol-phosphate aminotransferase/threonine-phosphate decarboxylase